MVGSGPTMTEARYVILGTAFVAWMAPAITEGKSGGPCPQSEAGLLGPAFSCVL